MEPRQTATQQSTTLDTSEEGESTVMLQEYTDASCNVVLGTRPASALLPGKVWVFTTPLAFESTRLVYKKAMALDFFFEFFIVLK